MVKKLFKFYAVVIVILFVLTKFVPSDIVAAETPEINIQNSSDFIKMMSEQNLNHDDLYPSVTIAQAILESNWGKSSLYRKYNNLFGIKSGGYWKGETVTLNTNEEINGRLVIMSGKFRTYTSLQDSINDRSRFLHYYKRYRKVINAPDATSQLQALQDCGYATDSRYAEKLLKLVTQYKLYQYDRSEEK